MADNQATRKGADINDAVDGSGTKGTVKALVSTIELAASSSGDTVDFGKIPSNARILAVSKVYWDDLATSGSPTLDIGLKTYINNDVTADPDALANGLDVTSASSGALTAVTTGALGDPAWDYINGVSSDPGGVFEVYGSIKDAATTQTGTVEVEILYYDE